MQGIEVAASKQLRGEILKRLYAVIGQLVTANSLRHALRPFGHTSDEQVRRALLYLADEQTAYIRLIGGDGGFWASGLALTARGVNLAEGDIDDDGVILDD